MLLEDMMRDVRKTMRSIAGCECDECREALATKLGVEVWPQATLLQPDRVTTVAGAVCSGL